MRLIIYNIIGPVVNRTYNAGYHRFEFKINRNINNLIDISVGETVITPFL